MSNLPVVRRSARNIALGLSFVVAAVAAMSSANAQTLPTRCVATFQSPLVIPIQGTLRAVHIDDSCRYAYVTNQSTNSVEVVSIATGQKVAPIPVGSQPLGLDTSADGKTLYVANTQSQSISVIDTNTGAELKRVPVEPGFSNDGPASLAVDANGRVLFSTTFAGSGFGGRLMQYDPATDAVTYRTDFWFFGQTTEITALKSSGDRSVIGIGAGDISSGPVFRYVAATDQFSNENNLNAFISDVALDRTGATMMVSPGTFVLDGNLLQTGVIPGTAFGVAVDPSGAIGYQVSGARVDVFDLKTFVQTDSLDTGSTLNGSPFGFNAIGHMSLSRDGSVIAVITDQGISLVKTKVVQAVPMISLAAKAIVHLPRAPSLPSVDLDATFTLAPDGKGIDPVTEQMDLVVGASRITIPPGSFKKAGSNFFYRGVIQGTQVSAVLQPVGPARYSLHFSGKGMSLDGGTLPLKVTLAIGDDSGNATLSFGNAALSTQ